MPACNPVLRAGDGVEGRGSQLSYPVSEPQNSVSNKVRAIEEDTTYYQPVVSTVCALTYNTHTQSKIKSKLA